MLKRGYVGTYHQMSVKHLDRYVSEFAGRHNARPLDHAGANGMHRSGAGWEATAVQRLGGVGEGKMEGKATLKRQFFYGDCKTVLEGGEIPPESVDLIYLDPPFNSKVSYNVLFGARRAKEQAEAFSDLWSWGPEDKNTLKQIRKKAESGNEEYQRLAKTLNAIETFLGECGSLSYLIYMGERLTLLRQVLKRTGSIYLHCDPTMSHYLKILMDAIFGPKNFRNEVVWKRNTSHNSGSQFGRIHDTLLFYSHEEKWTWNNTYAAEYSLAQLSRFKKDVSGRLYKGDDLTAARPDSDSGKFTWRGTKPGPTRGWAYEPADLEQMWEAGRILTKKNGSPRLDGKKVYLDELQGPRTQSIWDDISRIPNTSSERLGYPTQKPVDLLGRIIRASSNPGDVVLDPFAGCGNSIGSCREKRAFLDWD